MIIKFHPVLINFTVDRLLQSIIRGSKVVQHGIYSIVARIFKQCLDFMIFGASDSTIHSYFVAKNQVTDMEDFLPTYEDLVYNVSLVIQLCNDLGTTVVIFAASIFLLKKKCVFNLYIFELNVLRFLYYHISLILDL